MTAAADLSAFWLVSAVPTQRVASVLGELPEASRLDDSSSGQRGPLFERDDFSQILSAVDCESPDLSPQQDSSTADATERKSSSGVLAKQVFAASSLPLMRVIWLLVFVVGAALVLCGYLVGSLQSQMFVRVEITGNTKASVFGNEQTGLLRYFEQGQNDPVEIQFVPAAGLFAETDGIGNGSGRLFGQLEVEVQGYGCVCQAEVYRGEKLLEQGKVDGEVNGHDNFKTSVRMVGEESVRLVIAFLKANENVSGLKGCFYSYRLISKDPSQE
jgi:hypothetical protein